MLRIIKRAENLALQNKFSEALKILRGVNPSELNNDERGEQKVGQNPCGFDIFIEI